MRPNPLETADLFTFTGEVLNGKLYFLSSVCYWKSWWYFPTLLLLSKLFVFEFFLRVLIISFSKF